MRFREACKFKARRTADLLIAAGRQSPSAAIHRIESMLKGGDERSFAGRKGDEILSQRCRASDSHRTGNAQRHLCEAEETLNASLQRLGVNVGPLTADVLDLIPGGPQSLSTSE